MKPTDDPLRTRHSLLERASTVGDAATWEELIGYYAPFIRKVLLRMNFRGADLDDAHQQVCLKLWQGLASYRKQEDGARFRNWLATVIRNAAIDWIHKNRRHAGMLPLDEASSEALDRGEPELERWIEDEWQRHIVSCAMENLRGVFTGRAFEVLAMSLRGMEAEEIAAELGLRRESVYVLKSRVKNRFAQEIKRLRDELEGPQT